LTNVVETWNSVHNQFNISDAVVGNWVKTILSIDSPADCHLSVWEIKCAITIFSAEGWTVFVVSKLIPNDEVPIGVKSGFFGCAAELVLLTKELVGSKDGENAEDENDEEEDAEEAWDRLE
jgi:hypothetical protein